jgi:transcriptional regulator with XRE-family HTH domain
VDIGGALAAARSEAGLTVDQVSERTRIRCAIIRAIEQDDYSPCGGDFYVRGHIRAIARVVGTDPAPLIEQYDAAHGLQRAPHLEPGEGDPARTVTIAGNADGQTDPASRARPGGITAAEAFRPVMPLRIEGARRLPAWARVLVILAVALIAVLAYLLASQ